MRNKDSGETIANFSPRLRTSAYDGIETPFNFRGTEVYNAKGIEIFARTNDKTSIRNPLTFYIINNTDNKLAIGYDNVAYNSEMVMKGQSGVFLPAHSEKVFDMGLLLFTDVGISEVNRVDMQFHILPYNLDGSVSTNNAYNTPQITIIP